MLVSLKIKNFAIIHDLCIEFKEGLNILSGETGTGKSIIIQALQMVLGEREALGLPEGSELLIHRMVHASGRNKIWINGEMATLALLSQLSGLLVDVASQHAHQQLFQEETHLSILDSFGQHEMIRDHFRALFDQYREKLLFLEQRGRLPGTFQKVRGIILGVKPVEVKNSIGLGAILADNLVQLFAASVLILAVEHVNHIKCKI